MLKLHSEHERVEPKSGRLYKWKKLALRDRALIHSNTTQNIAATVHAKNSTLLSGCHRRQPKNQYWLNRSSSTLSPVTVCGMLLLSAKAPSVQKRKLKSRFRRKPSLVLQIIIVFYRKIVDSLMHFSIPFMHAGCFCCPQMHVACHHWSKCWTWPIQDIPVLAEGYA